jgi:O-antigen ligase
VLYNLLLLWYAYQNKQQIVWRNPVLWSVFGLAAASAISSSNAIFPIIAFKAWLIWSNYALAFYGSFLLLSFSPKEKNTIITIGATAYGVLLSYAAIQLLRLGLHYQNSYLMALPFAKGHTLLLAIGFPLWLYLSDIVFSRKGNKKQIILWFIYSLFIICSYSRLYWVLLLVFISLFILKYWKRTRWIFVVMGLMSIVTGYFGYHYMQEKRNREQAWLHPDDHNSWFVQVESIFEMHKNESNTERLYRWKMGKTMFDEHRFTGVGLNNYSEVYPEISKRFEYEKTTRSDVKMNAHQWYLGTLYEQGLLGILALALFFLAILSQYKRISFLGFLIIIQYFALGMVEDFMLLPEIIPAFWLCLGFLL